jgi:hypothetical protein
LHRTYDIDHVSTDYARNGVVLAAQVVSSVHPSPPPLRVGVITQFWPSWVYPFQHCSFDIRWICVTSDDSFVIEAICNTFPQLHVVTSLQGLGVEDNVDIVGVNGPISGFALVPPSFGCVFLFDWKFRNRGHWDDWLFYSSRISHLECGGVSSFVGCVTIGIHNLATSAFTPATLTPPFHGSFPFCTLSALTKCTVPGGRLFGPPPAFDSAGTPSVVSIGRNLYHFQGLFPFGNVAAEFHLPYVIGRPGQWVRRPLSPEELRDVYDIPVSGIRKRSIATLLPLFRVPVKVLAAVISHFFLDSSLVTGGGS